MKAKSRDISAFSVNRNPEKYQPTVLGVLTEVQTEHLPDTRQDDYRLATGLLLRFGVWQFTVARIGTWVYAHPSVNSSEVLLRLPVSITKE
jgi:hypothetical protein